MLTTFPFILHLRCACETIFDIMLSAYITGLKAYYVQSEEQGRKQGSKGPSLDGWDWARQSADRALAVFREAEVQRENHMVILILQMRPLIKLFLRYKRGINATLICSLINHS